MTGPAIADASNGLRLGDLRSADFDYLVPVDPMDELQCESCQ
jgi:hypothetical protein